jgi:DRG Family Regulatory Proteins, Tma46/Zinc finger C-x8-C-x5-C-x3-H type (and similar)
MAPKKPEVKKKDAKKAVEEKMFGMKNKGRSAKLKKAASDLEAAYMKGKAEAKKKKEESESDEYGVYQPAQRVQKIPVGVDPKKVLCMGFKKGQCKKGDKCMFSHDPSVEAEAEASEERRGEKIEERKGERKPEKICRFYIEALKNRKHGDKWVCPNGEACPNKHAPPEGYSLKGKKKEEEEISIEEYIEQKRSSLQGRQTPMTEELFKRWRENEVDQLAKRKEEEERIREGNVLLGKIVPSGRDLFVYNPELFVDDEEALECDYNAREDIESDEEEVERSLSQVKI